MNKIIVSMIALFLIGCTWPGGSGGDGSSVDAQALINLPSVSSFSSANFKLISYYSSGRSSTVGDFYDLQSSQHNEQLDMIGVQFNANSRTYTANAILLGVESNDLSSYYFCRVSINRKYKQEEATEEEKKDFEEGCFRDADYKPLSTIYTGQEGSYEVMSIHFSSYIKENKFGLYNAATGEWVVFSLVAGEYDAIDRSENPLSPPPPPKCDDVNRTSLIVLPELNGMSPVSNLTNAKLNPMTIDILPSRSSARSTATFGDLIPITIQDHNTLKNLSGVTVSDGRIATGTGIVISNANASDLHVCYANINVDYLETAAIQKEKDAFAQACTNGMHYRALNSDRFGVSTAGYMRHHVIGVYNQATGEWIRLIFQTGSSKGHQTIECAWD